MSGRTKEPKRTLGSRLFQHSILPALFSPLKKVGFKTLKFIAPLPAIKKYVNNAFYDRTLKILQSFPTFI